MTDLSDKLKSLGVKVGAGDIPQPRNRLHVPIEEVIEGRFINTPYGESFVVETLYPMDYKHGISNLNPVVPLRTISSWLREPSLSELDPQRLIFLDTETSGLAGGTGTYVFLIGLGRFTKNGFAVSQFFMRDPIEELAYLTALITFLSDCEGLVTFNGKAFDIPLLRTRFITNGEVFPIHSVVHIDLLPLARRLWKDRLPSRALGFLEEHILGTQRTIEDVPGWLIPSLYFDYLRTGDASPLKNVFYHNAIDIISMAALLNHIAGILEDPFHNTIQEGIDLIAMGKLYEDLGQFDAAAQCYADGMERDLPDTTRSEAYYRWSIMEKRRGNLDTAIEIWQHATTRNEIFAFVELAKLYEHRRQDYQQAIYWTQSVIELLDSSDFEIADRNRWQADSNHRLNRLLLKASK